MNHATTLDGCEWRPGRDDELVRRLAAAAGFAAAAPARPGPALLVPPADGIIEAARATGLRAETVAIPAHEAWTAIRRAVPAVLPLPGRGGHLAVLRAERTAAVLCTPLGQRRVTAAAIEDALWAPIVAKADSFPTGGLGVLAAGRARLPTAAARILASAQLSGQPLGEAWALRPQTATLRDELGAAGVGRRALAVVAAYLTQFALLVAIWNDVGVRTFAGAAPPRNWLTFGALLAAWVAAQLGASWLVSRLALDVGTVVRGALMRGALHLDRDRIRAAGLGKLLGRAMDAEVLDVLALGGAVEGIAALFELLLGTGVLLAGAAPVASLVTLALVLAALLAVARVQARRLFVWSARRRALTHDLVERMVGHRTVLIQDRPIERAAADELALSSYERETRALDRAEALLSVAIPRAWFLLALAVLAPAFLAHSSGTMPPLIGPPAAALLALSMGGVWLVYGALRRLGAALPTLALARDVWTELKPLVGVGGALVGEAPPSSTTLPDAARSGAVERPFAEERPPGAAPLLRASGVAYQYRGRSAPALEHVDVRINAGERVLIEGASGGGKSTLASLLTGLRVPTVGQLYLHGIPQESVGIARWRRVIAGAPQFHDNHVFCADLLFNVLMGRRWPPRPEDVEEAERVCRELGLGSLLERMPAGLQQQVGETGWRLSHGERSRLFLARSLLQHLEARVLDESFAALDPETLDIVMAAVLARPEALIVIAHP